LRNAAIAAIRRKNAMASIITAIKISDDERQDEIIPEALRYRFGWDELHDVVAARIIVEFKLFLPRDRELVRQLAVLRVAQSEIMSFGKYKGWLIEDALDHDPSYFEWLASQPDFRERRPRLFQLIVENDLGPEDASELENLGDYEFGCRKCGHSARFGYLNKTTGEMRWYCGIHRLAQRWADAKEPVP
jgi:uncharacterized protein (DUF3820 family)